MLEQDNLLQCGHTINLALKDTFFILVASYNLLKVTNQPSRSFCIGFEGAIRRKSDKRLGTIVKGTI